MQATLLQQMGWRTRPGIFGQHAASPQSIHALLGYFLNDRDSPTPFPGRDMLVDSALFANWACKLLRDTIVPIRYEVAASPLPWLLSLPYAELKDNDGVRLLLRLLYHGMQE